jgi:hypothetical protein
MSGLMVSFFLCGERAFSASALGDPRARPNQQIFKLPITIRFTLVLCETWLALSFLTDRAYCIFYPPTSASHETVQVGARGISHENVSGHKSMQIYAGTEDSPESPPPGRSLDTLDSSS